MAAAVACIGTAFALEAAFFTFFFCVVTTGQKLVR
jgi:hypothetical protein